MNRSPSGQWASGVGTVLRCLAGLFFLQETSVKIYATNAGPVGIDIKAAVDKETRARSWALGELRVGETRLIRIPLGIAGDRVLKMKEVEASCGCMQVLSYPAVVDKTSEITLRYVALKEGPVSVHVMAETEGPEAQSFEYIFNGAVVTGDRARAIMIESIAPELFFHRDAMIPDGLLISGAEARRESESGAVLIDLRSPAERKKGSPLNAMELPLHELRSKRFLTAQSVILLGSPILSEKELETIAALRTAGGTGVYYIDGGLGAWVEGGGAVLPKETAEELARGRMISPTELHAAANRERYLLVDATGDDLASVYLPEAVRLSTSPGDSEAMTQALARLRRETPSKTLVLVTKDGASQKAVSERLKDPTLYLLEGGLATYREFLASQTQSLLARRDGRNVIHARQGAVTASFPRELLGSGCSSCPGRH